MSSLHAPGEKVSRLVKRGGNERGKERLVVGGI